MCGARADIFASASSASKAASCQVVTPPKIKKADRYWCAPPIAKTPVIPIAEIDYVRRSELNFSINAQPLGCHAPLQAGHPVITPRLAEAKASQTGRSEVT